ncbi:hypothetical protein RHMOL_Rhmol01G0073700 [Rhododendron molle]|uniref:Uncharacterized protein n=1 Tax=Rhododendron molle TaxID=49168 RepID=A0ACC0Q0U2_RHOML|nr:hypothetical protein RHMOL_Rhmol01G0073700 [Rhododendron molle]
MSRTITPAKTTSSATSRQLVTEAHRFVNKRREPRSEIEGWMGRRKQKERVQGGRGEEGIGGGGGRGQKTLGEAAG